MKARSAKRWRLGFSAAAAGVLLLGLASCFCGVYFSRNSPSGATVGVSLARGAMFVVRSDNRAAAYPPKAGTHFSAEVVEGSPRILPTPAAPFEFGPSGDLQFNLRLPFWIPMLVLAGPAAWLWWKHLRRPPGSCASCGYDLHGTPGTRCPECGCAFQNFGGSRSP